MMRYCLLTLMLSFVGSMIFAQSVTISTTANCFNPSVVVPYVTDLNGKPAYDTPTGNLGGVSPAQISVLWANNRWEILVGGGTIAYINNNNTPLPPDSGWQAFTPSFPLGTCTASDPAPTLSGNVQTLPVEFISFQGSRLGKTVQLSWSTVLEVNNRGFQIQKSHDGQRWIDLDYIQGNGTSNELRKYEYVDTKPFNTISYYRLIQEDFDGASSMSKVVMVNAQQGELDFSIYPNPMANVLTIKANTIGQQTITWRLIDSYGKQIKAGQFDSNKPINQLNVEELEKGIYIIQLKTDQSPKNYKIIKN